MLFCLQWASELSAQTSKLYEREISIRKSFDGEETKNIVDNLFPGMDDVPPPFAVNMCFHFQSRCVCIFNFKNNFKYFAIYIYFDLKLVYFLFV